MSVLKPKHEAFAHAIAAGTAGADAYSALHPKANRKTATEKASRWARDGNIRARIAELRSALSDAQAKRDAEVAQDVASKLTVTLLQPRAPEPHRSAREAAGHPGFRSR